MSTPPIPSSAAVRLNYHDGMFLTSALMTQEQRYFLTGASLQNRYLYSPGVLNGLLASGQGKTVTVQGGVGFDGNGDFLIFPGASNNTLSTGSTTFNPFGVYVCFPALPSTNADTVDTAAVLLAGDTSNTMPNGIMVATVAVDAGGNIVSVTDARQPVKSLLPANLGTGPGKPTDLKAARQGKASFATAPAVGQSSELAVPFVDTQTQAFAVPPQVYVSVEGALPYAVEVSAINTYGFKLTLTSLQMGKGPIVVDWMALTAP